MDYLRFIRDNARFLGFGLLLAALSSYGQTFLIALFGAEIRTAFDLSNGEFGLIYSTATLVSGVSLIWLGRQLDRVDLRIVTVFVLLGAFLGCLLLAGARGVLSLGVALLLLRICGQGLLMHTAQTSMARYFDSGRGKAISIATLGLPLAEGVLPSIVVATAAGLGWRQTWLAMGGVLIVAVLPLTLVLLRGHGQRQARLEAAHRQAGVDRVRDWRRRDVLRDPRFYLLLPAVLAPPFIITALFFHQAPLAAEKGWEIAWLARCFAGFAVSHVTALLVSGPLVDRIGAQRLLPFYLLPLGLALLVLNHFEAPLAALAYLSLAGLSVGTAGTIMGALWAELYGVAHLGAIRALAQSLMVLSTAIAPALMGLALDVGVAMATMAGVLCAWAVVASALAGVGVRRRVGGMPAQVGGR